MIRIREIYLNSLFPWAISLISAVMLLIYMFTFTGKVEFRKEFTGCFRNTYSNRYTISLLIGDGYVEADGERIPTEMYRDKVGFSLSPKQRIYIDGHGKFVLSKGYTSLIRLSHDSVTLSTETGVEFKLYRVPCEL